MVTILPWVFWQLHDANTALHGFTDALIAKQYERAYGLTASEFRTFTDYGTFVKVHDGLTLRMGDLKSVEWSQSEAKERSDGWYATMDAHLIFTRGSLDFVMVLKKENSSWMVYSYHEE